MKVSVLALLWLCAPWCAEAQDAPKPYTPTAEYAAREVVGWRVRVSPELRAHPDEEKAALGLLRTKLEAIRKLLPGDRVKVLRKVTFWVEWRAKENGAAEYHPSRQWLTEHGYNPEKARGIELSNAKNFVAWQEKDQPMMVLHELAHAYQDATLGFNSTDVKAAYDAALKSGIYESVDYVRGGKKRAYALTDPQEYFAELTEAYFGRNDFYPFTREELRRHDPQGFALMELAWGRSRPEERPDTKAGRDKEKGNDGDPNLHL